jgi:solute carrier family 32 (vesicular inhibitory amino acid transporter)
MLCCLFNCSPGDCRVRGKCGAGVVAYSLLISMSVPHFSSLVALITSATYLTCAYTIPCWFTLLLLKDRINRLETLACMGLIPLSVALSCGGLAAAARSLMQALSNSAQ